MNSFLLTWHTPAVKKLLGWRQGGEEEKWAEKAVDSLVKKLRKKKNGSGGCGTVEDLEFALANPQNLSKCVTIPKSLDGRLQVSHKKGLPHVIYCRVWRWPDLQSHQELRAIPECMYAYDPKNLHICINPYHYIRCGSSREGFVQHAGSHGGYPVQHQPNNPRTFSPASVSGNSSMASSPALNMQTPNSPQSNYATASPSSGCSSSYMTAISPSSVVSDDDDITMISHQQMANVANQLLHISPPYYWATISYYELNTRVGDAFKIQGKVIVVDGFTDPTECDSRICLGLITNVNRNSTIENTRKHIGRGLRLECSPDHNITLTNLSEASIFVQSRNCNIKMSQDPTSVQRIPPGGSCTVFDNSLFTNVHSFNFEFEFITHGNWVVRYRKGVFHVRGNMRSKELKTYEVEGVHVDFGKNFRVIGHSYSSGSIVWEGGEGLGRYSFKVSNSSLKPDCILPT